MLIELSEDEALVLFDLLHDYGTKDAGRHLAITCAAERNALWAIEAALQKVLAAPFRQDYTKLLDAARTRVEEQGGGWDPQ